MGPRLPRLLPCILGDATRYATHQWPHRPWNGHIHIEAHPIQDARVFRDPDGDTSSYAAESTTVRR